MAEIEVRTGTLDNRNMVCDFSDIKRVVKGWIDRELDHKMILRHDDPLVAPLKSLGEPIFIVDSNPTVERIARLIFDQATDSGVSRRPRHGVGDADVVRRVPCAVARRHVRDRGRRQRLTRGPFQLIVFDLDGTLIDSRRDIAESANALLVECGAQPLPETQVGRMVGDGAATLIARAFLASGVERPPDALARFMAIYERHLTNHTRPYAGIVDALDVLAARATLALLTNKPVRPTLTILERLVACSVSSSRHSWSAGMVPVPRKPDPAGLVDLRAAGRRPRRRHGARR